MFLQGEQFHFIEDMVDGMLDRRMRTHAAGPFRFVDVENRFGREIAGFAAILQHPIEDRRAPGVESHAVDGVLGSELVADAVGFDQLDARLALAHRGSCG